MAGAALVALRRQFLFGRSFDDLVVAPTRESFRRFRERVLASNVRLVHDNVLATGRGLVPVHVEGGRLSGPAFSGDECILCMTDESERQAVDAQKRQLDATDAESRRIASLGTLAAGVAHDFNNILAISMAYADLILLEDGVPAATLDHVRAIREATRRAVILSEQMLAYTGRAVMAPELLDLSAVVRSAMDAIRALVRHGSLRFDLTTELPPVRGDAAQLAEILSNLVTNAAEAIAVDGSIVVRTRTDVATGRVLVEVSDDGRGMDEMTLKRAFDPFFSSKFSGRGLELAVVHGNAVSHGATVGVESRLHHGATLRVAFPPARPLRASPANDLKSAPRPTDKGVVLVVDDEKSLRDVISHLLEGMGFGVFTAGDGLEAIARMDAPPAPIAAIVLDLTMPRLSG